MKKTVYIISCLFLAWIGCISCSEDFLDRTPQTKLTAEGFFNTAGDLQLYVNGLYYTNMRYGKDIFGTDTESDNCAVYQTSYGAFTGLSQILAGTVTPENFGGWDEWEKLRAINYLLAHAPKATGVQEDIDHYIGVTRFFRALWYFKKIVSYSDVPWYGRPLDVNDEEFLYKAADPRTLVVDSILADLQFAVDHIKPALGDKSAVHKYTALAEMSRFCLFEGTFRKYHSELNLQNTAGQFLEKAIWASEQLMSSGQFNVPAGSSGLDYRALFNSPAGTLAGNPDVILMYSVSREQSIGHNSHILLEENYVALSNSLMETYLMADGTPFTSQPGYNEKTIVEAFQDRDPRLSETFTPPGWVLPYTGAVWIPFPVRGGYGQLKGYPIDQSLRGGWDQCYNAVPMYRYAEALLNYAEAKAELGTLTQTDLDNTVNRLRDRVGMTAAHLNLAAANAAPDAILAGQYDKVTGANRGVILEIRRERRVEMACEGQRFRDVTRWAAGKLLSEHPKGMYVPALGPLDVTGDGEPDVAFLRRGDTEPEGITYLVYIEEGAYLDGPDGTSGHVMFTSDLIDKKPFEEPKWYYRPIPLQQTVLNPNLKQVFGW